MPKVFSTDGHEGSRGLSVTAGLRLSFTHAVRVKHFYEHAQIRGEFIKSVRRQLFVESIRINSNCGLPSSTTPTAGVCYVAN